jgi:hypothetical protein
MRVIFDENVPAPLRQFLPHHEVTTVPEQGWAGIGNGELVARCELHFDVLVLADKNLRYQQNLRARRLALVELPTNRWPALQSLRSEICAAVDGSTPGSYRVVE